MAELTDIEEDYLRNIFDFHCESPEAIVKTTQLAEIMGVSPASTTEMIQRLSASDMVTHIPYKGCRLTPDGFQLAAKLRRREYLIEMLLSEVVGFQGDIALASSQIAHVINDDLEATLDRLLGYPEKTANGTKIPAIERALKPISQGLLLPISSIPIGSEAEIELIIANDIERKTIADAGIKIGGIVSNLDGEICCNSSTLSLSSDLSKRVLARLL